LVLSPGGSVPTLTLLSRANAAPDSLVPVTDSLLELSARLQETAALLRAGELDPEATLALIEECAQLASEASAEVDQRVRAALEPLPDLPGQLPLPAA
jgi:hypothetical protein